MFSAVRTLTVVLTMTASIPALAQAPLPPGVFAAERDIALATAGAYTLDEAHTAVIVRVSHLGYSQSVFRFDRVNMARRSKRNCTPGATCKITAGSSKATIRPYIPEEVTTSSPTCSDCCKSVTARIRRR